MRSFIVGAVEFGISGFGAGFVGALSSGASFSEAIKAGGIGAAAGAVAGGIIQGSYHAGWQKSMHGYDDPRIAARNREVGLYRGYNDIAPGDLAHEGIEIVDSSGELSGRWEFDTIRKDPITKLDVLRGLPVDGAWQVRSQPFQKLIPESNSLAVVKSAYNDIQSQLGKVQIYGITGIPTNCRTATNRVIDDAKK